MIFVDEFQDVNRVQNAIVEKLRRENNLFLVGDIKQSIYGFRQCEPRIFAEKTERFKATGEGSVVYMNDNFRSHAAILDFVNTVFSGVMTHEFGTPITPPTVCSAERATKASTAFAPWF